jgi:hypothetical protein
MLAATGRSYKNGRSTTRRCSTITSCRGRPRPAVAHDGPQGRRRSGQRFWTRWRGFIACSDQSRTTRRSSRPGTTRWESTESNTPGRLSDGGDSWPILLCTTTIPRPDGPSEAVTRRPADRRPVSSFPTPDLPHARRKLEGVRFALCQWDGPLHVQVSRLGEESNLALRRVLPLAVLVLIALEDPS